MFKRNKRHIPPSPEFFESTDLVVRTAIEDHDIKIRKLEQFNRRSKILIFMSGMAVYGMLSAVAPHVFSWIDHEDGQKPRETAADYGFPQDGYEARCSDLSVQTKELADTVNRTLISLYSESPDVTEKEFETVSDNPGSYGGMSYKLPVENGFYSVYTIVASGESEIADSESGFSISMRGLSDNGIEVSVDIGLPPVGESGGPNYPIEFLSLIRRDENGSETRYTWANDTDTTPQQCQAVFDEVSPVALHLLNGMTNRAPVTLPN